LKQGAQAPEAPRAPFGRVGPMLGVAERRAQ